MSWGGLSVPVSTRIGGRNILFSPHAYFGKLFARYYASNGDNCTPLRGFFIYLSLETKSSFAPNKVWVSRGIGQPRRFPYSFFTSANGQFGLKNISFRPLKYFGKDIAR